MMKKYKSFICLQIFLFINLISHVHGEVCRDIAQYLVKSLSQQQAKEIAQSTTKEIVQNSLKEPGKSGWSSYVPSLSTVVKIGLKVAVVGTATAFTGPVGGAVAGSLIDVGCAGADLAQGNLVGAGLGILFIPLNFVGLGSAAKEAAQNTAKQASVNQTKELVKSSTKEISKKSGQQLSKQIAQNQLADSVKRIAIEETKNFVSAQTKEMSKKIGKELSKFIAQGGIKEAVKTGLSEAQSRVLKERLLSLFIQSLSGLNGATKEVIEQITEKLAEDILQIALKESSKNISNTVLLQVTEDAVKQALAPFAKELVLKRMSFESLQKIASIGVEKILQDKLQNAGKGLLEQAIKNSNSIEALLSWFLKNCA
ncbi:hypothetical protein ABPG72_013584 [Tetrahymena utriculariae]